MKEIKVTQNNRGINEVPLLFIIDSGAMRTMTGTLDLFIHINYFPNQNWKVGLGDSTTTVPATGQG